MDYLKISISMLIISCLCNISCAQLRVGFYNSSCPRAESIVREVVLKSVPTGRRDGFVSDVFEVDLPGPELSISDAAQFFVVKGLTLNDMVALMGAHSVGVAHCGFFQDRLSDFQGSGKPDPTMNPALAARLSRTCGRQSRPLNKDPTVNLDQNTTLTLDNEFYHQVRSRNGILQIDQELALDKSTASLVFRLAANSSLFRQAFAAAMIKLGKVEVLVGKNGEVRKNCRVFNKSARPKTPKRKTH
ncbi:OLC1v1036167C1 [Oldenlandia corymbosa var. corymbosa]|uniref:peroxidase n=1 Tax=Oldenlandia corymbosa var. corymbosa TaxID=529605 RepID=A0AAV1CWL8_OLDCO|nr:OLC1v1036167C1 [Oldenlandia corymbosa var. corymbosa]